MIKWYENVGQEPDVIVSTRLRLARNLQEFPFPCRLRAAQRHKVEELVLTSVANDNLASYDFGYISMEQASKTLAISLVERKLVSPELISERNGRGVLLTPDESVSIMVNEEDHLRLQAMRPGLDLECAFSLLNELDRVLNRELCFAFDENLGYLTQNPGDLGTGMHVSLLLHLPVLKRSGAVARVGVGLSRLGLSLRGGWAAQPAADMFLLSNRVTLGLSEQAAISNLKMIGMQLVQQEREARRELSDSLEIQDRVSRSLAILRSAKLLSNDEFMEMLSNVRLGLSMGQLDSISYETLNTLLMRCQPATILLESGQATHHADYLRASLVRELLN